MPHATRVASARPPGPLRVHRPTQLRGGTSEELCVNRGVGSPAAAGRRAFFLQITYCLDASLNVGGPGGTAGDGRPRGVSLSR